MQKKLLLYLFIANIIDAIATDIGLRHGVITEANIGIAFIYEASIFLYYLIKVGGVSLGIYLLLHLQDKLQHKKVITLLLVTASLIYSGVLVLHVIWIALWLG